MRWFAPLAVLASIPPRCRVFRFARRADSPATARRMGESSPSNIMRILASGTTALGEATAAESRIVAGPLASASMGDHIRGDIGQMGGDDQSWDGLASDMGGLEGVVQLGGGGQLAI